MKTVLVTGGSRGIGKCIVENLAIEGYNVVLNYNKSVKEAKQIKQNLKEKGINIEIYKADVSKREEIKKIVKYTLKKYGKIDILINNAAIDPANLFHLKTAEEFRRTLDVNVVGAYNCSKRVYKHMLQQEYGKIINISSTNGINTYYPMCF